MPYVKNEYIEDKICYGIVGLAVSNVIAFIVIFAMLASGGDEETDTGPSAVARCREISPYKYDGSDDEHVCEAVTENCQVGTSNARCIDDPTPCLAVMTSASGDDPNNQFPACYYTPAELSATGESLTPNTLMALTCADHDQTAGFQPYPCPLTPGTEDTPWLSTANVLREDAAGVDCENPQSLTTSCSVALCCIQPPAPMTCQDTNGDGETGDLFDCRAGWVDPHTPGAPPVTSSYNLDPTRPCERNAGGCTPYDCCTIPPAAVEEHDISAEEYPSNAVERFYEGLDTKNITLMESKVALGYQAIFTEGCVELGGATHCGSAVYTLAQLDLLIQTSPTRVERFPDVSWNAASPGVGWSRDLIVTMDNTNTCPENTLGGCGVVMEEYIVQETDDSAPIRSAAVHKVVGGLIAETIWYTNARGKQLKVQQFFTQMTLCGSDNHDACDELDQYVNPLTYVAIFSPSGVEGTAEYRPAAVGGIRKVSPSPGATMNLEELKTFLRDTPARCNPTSSISGSAGSCQMSDQVTYDQQGNSVIEKYNRAVVDPDGSPVEGFIEGISVNRFVADGTSSNSKHAKIVETYFYTQHADEQCSDAGRARIATEFLETIDMLSILPPGSCLAGDTSTTCQTRGRYIHKFDDLYWHDGDDRVGAFTAVITSGTHTLGMGIKWVSSVNRIYDEQTFRSLIQHTQVSAGLGVDTSGAAINYNPCVSEEEALQSQNDAFPRTQQWWRCIRRTYVSQGDNVFVQYQVYGGSDNDPVDQEPEELGGVLLTFDEEKITQAYWCGPPTNRFFLGCATTVAVLALKTSISSHSVRCCVWPGLRCEHVSLKHTAPTSSTLYASTRTALHWVHNTLFAYLCIRHCPIHCTHRYDMPRCACRVLSNGDYSFFLNSNQISAPAVYRVTSFCTRAIVFC